MLRGLILSIPRWTTTRCEPFRRKAITLAVLLISGLAGQSLIITDSASSRRHSGAVPSTPPAVLSAAGSTISVQMNAGRFRLPAETILKWMERSANGVAHYFGKFPVATLRIAVIDEPGHGMSFGETSPLDEATIKMWLGTETTESDLKKEWTLVHEMVHLGFPFTDDDANWATEGLATYVEPIVRSQMGDQSKEEFWETLKTGMPQGLPEPADKGLSITHTWANTYWGGALFYLLADIQIRRETKNKKGLPDALRAINAAGGNIFEDWDLPKTFGIGDRATGTKVLMQLYHKMATHRGTTDLDALWKDLGVISKGGHLVLDPNAPLAKVRQAIESGHP